MQLERRRRIEDERVVRKGQNPAYQSQAKDRRTPSTLKSFDRPSDLSWYQVLHAVCDKNLAGEKETMTGDLGGVKRVE
jgi:hypothetical protein